MCTLLTLFLTLLLREAFEVPTFVHTSVGSSCTFEVFIFASSFGQWWRTKRRWSFWLWLVRLLFNGLLLDLCGLTIVRVGTVLAVRVVEGDRVFTLGFVQIHVAICMVVPIRLAIPRAAQKPR